MNLRRGHTKWGRTDKENKYETKWKEKRKKRRRNKLERKK